jgi:hypothetical protein
MKRNERVLSLLLDPDSASDYVTWIVLCLACVGGVLAFIVQ